MPDLLQGLGMQPGSLLLVTKLLGHPVIHRMALRIIARQEVGVGLLHKVKEVILCGLPGIERRRLDLLLHRRSLMCHQAVHANTLTLNSCSIPL